MVRPRLPVLWERFSRRKAGAGRYLFGSILLTKEDSIPVSEKVRASPWFRRYEKFPETPYYTIVIALVCVLYPASFRRGKIARKCSSRIRTPEAVDDTIMFR